MYRAIALAYTDRFYSDSGAVDTYNSRPALDSGFGHLYGTWNAKFKRSGRVHDARFRHSPHRLCGADLATLTDSSEHISSTPVASRNQRYRK